MNRSLKDMCCFCLCDDPFYDIFSKNENCIISHFEKISSALSQISEMLIENPVGKYKVCKKCSATIEMIYEFSISCINNLKIFLSQKDIFEVEIKKEHSIFSEDQTNEEVLIKTEPFSDEDVAENLDIPQDVSSKQEFGEGKNSMNFVQVDMETEEIKTEYLDYVVDPLVKENIADHSLELDTGEGNDNRQIKEEQLYPKNDKISHESQKSILVLMDNKNQYTCNICKKSFNDIANLNIHMKNHTTKRLFTCGICEEIFTRMIELNRHMSVHTGEKPLYCKICNKEFRCQARLDIHELTHSGVKSYECGECRMQFTKQRYLLTHKSIHTGEKPYECQRCPKQFRLSSGLTQHVKLHSGVKPYVCDICDKAFATKSTLTVHKKIHTGEKPYTCEVCSKSFTKNSSCKRHNKYFCKR